MVLGQTNRNYEEVKKQIIKHEGKRNQIYLDHLGNKSWGIGHLVLPSDNLQEGVEYSDDTIMEYFERDFQQALSDARSFIEEESINPVAFGCVINMAFC
jgi:GH24 family phage-related lysozyme (muramidase)